MNTGTGPSAPFCQQHPFWIWCLIVLSFWILRVCSVFRSDGYKRSALSRGHSWIGSQHHTCLLAHKIGSESYKWSDQMNKRSRRMHSRWCVRCCCFPDLFQVLAFLNLCKLALMLEFFLLCQHTSCREFSGWSKDRVCVSERTRGETHQRKQSSPWSISWYDLRCQYRQWWHRHLLCLQTL